MRGWLDHILPPATGVGKRFQHPMRLDFNAMKLACRFTAVVFILLMLSGCGTLPGGQRWGEHARLKPGWDRVGTAAAKAALDPLTWAPLVGSAVFLVGDLDESFSEWAADETPVFGSRGSADDAGDVLLGASMAVYGITAIAAPGGDDPGKWVSSKVQGGAVGGAAAVSWLGSVYLLKDVVDRTRPDGSDRDGFPSGHASGSALFTTLASRNAEYILRSDIQRRTTNIGLSLMTAGTAWARIEAEEHFPSDVLAGIALGHFLGAFFNDAFLQPGSAVEIRPAIDLPGKSAMLQFTFSY